MLSSEPEEGAMSAWGRLGCTEKISHPGCSARSPSLFGRNEDVLRRHLDSFGYRAVETMEQENRIYSMNVMLE